MRCILKVRIPNESGNALITEGRLKEVMGGILEEIKPEAAYFYAEGGVRTGIFVVDVAEPSRIPAIAEPFFLGLGATVEMFPAMTPEDLMKAGPDLEAAAKKWGGRQPAIAR